jgi:hypothetical protein
MALTTIPAASVTLPTRRTTVFTSSTTWTVPSSCLYADVMVVGGGQGGQGGFRNIAGVVGGAGGGVTYLKDIYLGGTGTVSITVGAGSSGNAGTTATSEGGSPSTAGHSAFGTYVYSSGGFTNAIGGQPGYKGTNNSPYRGGDTTVSNFAPLMSISHASNDGGVMRGTGVFARLLSTIDTASSSTKPVTLQTLDGNGWGHQGGTPPSSGAAGGAPGGIRTAANDNSSVIATTNVSSIPWVTSTSFLGAAVAGGASSGTGGDAGPTGFAGGGGSSGVNNSILKGASGGPGGGGGGGNGTSGQNGGAGGNAGTNTGAGGGAGGCTGSAGAGTGGNGGNGASGFVIVSYIGTN